MIRPKPRVLTCAWAQPGTLSWLRAEMRATSLNELPEVELKFKGDHPPIDVVGARSVLAAAAPLVAAGLLVLAFPPFDAGPLAWVALAPLARACIGAGAACAFAYGLVFGLVFTLGVFRWMFDVPGFGAAQAVPLALYLALYPALWCAALPRLARSRVPLPLAAAAWWVALDWMRSHAGFLALPWATLAHSQHDNLAILQVASVTGEAGITALVVAANVALAVGWRRRRLLGVVAAVAVSAHAAGMLALRADPAGPPLTVAIVQSPSASRLAALTEEAAREGARLVVWPESAVRSVAQLPRLGDLAERTGTAVIAGVVETEKLASGTSDPVTIATHDLYNSAWLVTPDGRHSEPYRKQRLLPFAETLPLARAIAWPSWLVSNIHAIAAGPADPPPLRAPAADVGVLICWEGLFADLARASVRQGAQVLVQPTNDSWFGSSAAARQHNLAAVLRAVELGTPVVLASTTGPSQIVAANGRIVARVGAGQNGMASARVALRSRDTLYARWGDAWLELVTACAAVAFTLRRSMT